MRTDAAHPGATEAPGAFDLLERDADHIVFTSGRLFVMNWRVSTNVDAVRRVSTFIARFAQSFSPARIGLLTVIELGAAMPPTPSRSELAKLMRVNTPYLIRSAVGYEGTGFRGAAFRGASTGIALLSNHQFPHRIFAGVPAAAEWLAAGMAQELHIPVTGSALAEIVERARKLPPVDSRVERIL